MYVPKRHGDTGGFTRFNRDDAPAKNRFSKGKPYVELPVRVKQQYGVQNKGDDGRNIDANQDKASEIYEHLRQFDADHLLGADFEFGHDEPKFKKREIKFGADDNSNGKNVGSYGRRESNPRFGSDENDRRESFKKSSKFGGDRRESFSRNEGGRENDRNVSFKKSSRFGGDGRDSVSRYEGRGENDRNGSFKKFSKFGGDRREPFSRNEGENDRRESFKKSSKFGGDRRESFNRNDRDEGDRRDSKFGGDRKDSFNRSEGERTSFKKKFGDERREFSNRAGGDENDSGESFRKSPKFGGGSRESSSRFTGDSERREKQTLTEGGKPVHPRGEFVKLKSEFTEDKRRAVQDEFNVKRQPFIKPSFKEKVERKDFTKPRPEFVENRGHVDNSKRFGHNDPSSQEKPHRPRPDLPFDGQVKKSEMNPFNDYLYGTEVVLAALKASKRTKIGPLYLLEGKSPGILSTSQEGGDEDAAAKKQQKDVSLDAIMKLARNANVHIKRVSKHDLNVLSDNRPHNGVVLQAGSMSDTIADLGDNPPVIEEAPVGQTPPIWIAVDQVMDPQNLGAILRNAFYFGVSGVILCKKNCSPVSSVVCKVSAGASEFLNLRYCSSMPRLLRNCVASGNFNVIGLSLKHQAVDCSKVQLKRPTIVVVGNEGFGMRAMVEEQCSQLVKIRSFADRSLGHNVDSLNAASSLGIMLHQLKQ
eukprot:TRINITY_DN6533_c0_g1_i6.p1 TRINITY_DN6533_c0_g1~~TRINITY_DN6533_c0_g1_i6.p1  ORF type:complete len:765 (-),score=216.62 TRINITY_DN6533_c0_g1_i6:633-2738(-)